MAKKKMPSAPIKTTVRPLPGGLSENLGWGYQAPKNPTPKAPAPKKGKK